MSGHPLVDSCTVDAACPGTVYLDTVLVARLHVDLQRVLSAACPAR